ncbi:MAG: sterol desaturase family protein [Bacteroidota bacterium]|jgi:sterol desaturase/sphingolipid hydroxylase (fatty acid hydroxylase superfamily)
MTLIIVGVGLFLMILERIIPDQRLPNVKGWWPRVILLNLFQFGILVVGKVTWDNWFGAVKLFSLGEAVNNPLGGFISYLVTTFVFYWWHRWRHTVNFLWLSMHQVHHSPQRIETITSFFKHPFEVVVNSLIIGSISFSILGLNAEGAAWCLLFSALGEYFYHMNIKTPHWVGYFFQRPEMHRIHHERGKHYCNFSDIPLWDILFGTFNNPKEMNDKCGFKPEREIRLSAMLFFKNVNNEYPPKNNR